VTAVSQTAVDRETIADNIFPALRVQTVGPPYLTRLILRFSQPDSEVVITTLLDGRRVVEDYTLPSGTTILGAAAQVLHRIPAASSEEIANVLKVHRSSVRLPPKQVDQWFFELKKIPHSLVLEPILHLDSVSQYDFWFDANGDFVHYRFSYAAVHPPQNLPLDSIATWALKIRSEVEYATKR
jgi:hypothetical protein